MCNYLRWWSGAKKVPVRGRVVNLPVFVSVVSMWPSNQSDDHGFVGGFVYHTVRRFPTPDLIAHFNTRRPAGRKTRAGVQLSLTVLNDGKQWWNLVHA